MRNPFSRRAAAEDEPYDAWPQCGDCLVRYPTMQGLEEHFNREPEHRAATALEGSYVTTTTDPEETGAHLEEDDTDDEFELVCPTCRGTGRQFTTTALLRASLELFPKTPAELDAFVAEFYRRLIARDESMPAGDRLGPLFPADLLTGDALNSQGHRQRDMLLNALVALGLRYDPDRPGSGNMRYLTAVLEKAGRDHSSFLRPDGSQRGATPEEYLIVRDVLFGLLRGVFGERWLPEYDEAWSAAYRFAMDLMLRAADAFRPPGAVRSGPGRVARPGRAESGEAQR